MIKYGGCLVESIVTLCQQAVGGNDDIIDSGGDNSIELGGIVAGTGPRIVIVSTSTQKHADAAQGYDECFDMNHNI